LPPPLKSSIQHRPQECAEAFLSAYALQYKKYFLTIGTLEPRKNFIGLVDAYLDLLKNHNDIFPLAIVGGGGWKNAAIVEKLKLAERQFPDKIKLLRHISDDALSHLLSGARYYLCFSLYEGYGMPLAEARTCRTPVICFDQPEMREAAENDGIFLPSVGFEEILAQHLLAQNLPIPSGCQYVSNQEKARLFSHAILDLLRTK
jgi:alpha-1,3-rhamnosyl/mannosyltransferase